MSLVEFVNRGVWILCTNEGWGFQIGHCWISEREWQMANGKFEDEEAEEDLVPSPQPHGPTLQNSR